MLNLNRPLPGEEELGRKLTPAQRDIIDRLAGWVVRRGMTTPAVLFLESIKPLSYIGSQAVVFFSPALEILFAPDKVNAFALLMEDKKNIELFLREIERRDGERQKKMKELKAQHKAMKQQRKQMRKMERDRKKGGV